MKIFAKHPLLKLGCVVIVVLALGTSLVMSLGFSVFRKSYTSYMHSRLLAPEPFAEQQFVTAAALDFIHFMQQAQDRKAILYFNDSTMGGFTAIDAGERRTSELLSEAIGLPIFGISGPGFSPVMYVDIIKAVGDRLKDKVGTIIFQVNMRYFSHGGFFSTAYYRPLRSFINAYVKVIDRKMYSDYLFGKSSLEAYFDNFFGPKIPSELAYELKSAPSLSDETSPSTEVPTPIRSKVAQDYHDAYGVMVTADHPMLKAMTELCDVAHSKNVKVFAYITPINYEHLRHLLGDGHLDVLRQNVKVIRNALAGSGAAVFDYSELLQSRHFPEDWYANEHLSNEGRRKLVAVMGRDFLQWQSTFPQ